MSLKTLLLATAGWTLFTILCSVGAFAYVMSHPLDGVPLEQRSQQLGSGIGTLAAFGYAAIWLPYAYKLGQQRREAAAAERKRSTARRPRRK